nr:Chain D, ATP-dependent DNA helicase PIF1 [Saccharomyces cerevisiae S288C]6E49_E Chain E, ATP-dependent DNA helicase PIF1 [Saccharomyces cerevisiae S288C]6E49_F Chain F, ATP-dependent DNA helicase PIF1 [Saccharomyces cerevisiae S288C]
NGIAAMLQRHSRKRFQL